MEIKLGYPPLSALEVENTIRNNCQHYGYPDAVVTLDATGCIILKLHTLDPLTSPCKSAPSRSSTSPKC